ncbi:type II toxin-antitoxin system RelE/ParE family toxin [Ruminococcus sp.]|uniref:type II toxin-antitoxin system RelE/ParE family toxin n=1 Tax=Ruminococcus sp. TaxID=41978 RepID=UPI0035212E91
MNYKIVFTPNSKNDLYGIFRYIAFDLQAFENAAGQLDRLESAVKSLEQLPLRFRVYEKNLEKS